MNIDDNDEDLLLYAETHCRTERALFHRNHLARIYKLAGKAVPGGFREYVAVHADQMDPLVKEARRRMRQAKLTLVP